MGRIIVDKTMAQFSVKTDAPLALWNTLSGQAMGKSAQATELNQKLNKIVQNINCHYRRLLQTHETLTAEQLRTASQGIASEQETLIKYFTQYIEAFKKRVGLIRKPATLFDLQNALRHLSNFIRKKYKLTDIPFCSLNFSFIESYDFYLRVELQLKPNTILAITSKLRRMANHAFNEGIIACDPFCGYAPQRPKPEQKYLTRTELNKIMTTPLDRPNRYLIRDMFIFSCFTGLGYRDMYNLTEKNIIPANDGVLWIKANRQKTGALCCIPLMDIPLKIIGKYSGLTKNGKLFPMISNEKTNKNLRKIGEICGLERRLTFHAGRHTYASEITLSQGVPIESVSSMLGHSDLRSTRIYAKITNEKMNEDMKKLEMRIKGKYQLTQI
ncbi:tyrosine recombinase [Bacteroidia bacterium]|nr:tyrosine recombinase [Bacteroidia bacterium]GHV71490.1 tyrosine recombinase [Bacteroidia bacterium]